MLGKLLNNRFKVLKPLGSGGMGRVYQAIQVPLDRLVALKVLDPTYGEGKDPGFRKRFLLEASLTAQLHHPNTITVHDYGRTEEGIYFIAMEYLEGKTLAQVLSDEGPLGWDRAMNIAKQVCRSLREAHKLGLVHRDLKPANVMILTEESDGDVIKVLDFGLVKPFLPDAPGQDLEITQAGVLLGSPLYMAPEQSKNESDPRSDIYSMGVLLYQMLTGRPPFMGKESIEVIVKHIRERPVPVRNLRPDVPAEVEGLVMRCLEKVPAKRFQSMDELLEAIRQVYQRLGQSGAISGARALAQSGPKAFALTSSESGVRATSQSAAHARAAGTNRRLLAGALFACSVAIGLTAVHFIAQQHLPQLTRTEEHQPPAAPAAPALQKVTFSITSQPPGARVSVADKAVGVTPFELELAPDRSGVAMAELTFLKDGYQPASVTARGSGPRVEVSQKLQRRAAPKPSPKATAAPQLAEEP